VALKDGLTIAVLPHSLELDPSFFLVKGNLIKQNHGLQSLGYEIP